MAKTLDRPLDTGRIRADLLKLAAQCSQDEMPDRTSALRLAAALIAIAGSQTESDSTDSTFETWRRQCGDVLTALAPALESVGSARRGNPEPASRESLVAVTRSLVMTAASAADALYGQCQRLREEGSQLLRAASQCGAAERSLGIEKARLAEQLKRTAAAEAALQALGPEEIEIVRRVADLQERLRIAQRTPEDVTRLEAEVHQAETRAKELHVRHQALGEALSTLQAEDASLIERLAHTESAIRELEQSPNREIAALIREIWARIRALQEPSR